MIIRSEPAFALPDARKYRSFADLAEAQVRGRDFRISVTRRAASRVAVIAPHAGGIEDGTSEVARRSRATITTYTCSRERGPRTISTHCI